MSFSNKVAVVTGGGSGMGAATSLQLAAAGARVVVADLNAEGGVAVIEAIELKGGRAVFQETDVSAKASTEAMVARALSEYGRLDLAANVAGVPQTPTPLVDTSLELWDLTHGVNDRGLFLSLQAEIPAMLESGGGSIVNVSSLNGLRSFPQMIAYGSSKFGAISTTMTVAAEFASQGIRVNAIAPGSIDTPMLAGLPADTLQQFTETLPMKRLGTADEIASVALFLLSDAAAYVTGAVVPVDGGWLASP